MASATLVAGCRRCVLGKRAELLKTRHAGKSSAPYAKTAEEWLIAKVSGGGKGDCYTATALIPDSPRVSQESFKKLVEFELSPDKQPIRKFFRKGRPRSAGLLL